MFVEYEGARRRYVVVSEKAVKVTVVFVEKSKLSEQRLTVTQKWGRLDAVHNVVTFEKQGDTWYGDIELRPGRPPPSGVVIQVEGRRGAVVLRAVSPLGYGLALAACLLILPLQAWLALVVLYWPPTSDLQNILGWVSKFPAAAIGAALVPQLPWLRDWSAWLKRVAFDPKVVLPLCALHVVAVGLVLTFASSVYNLTAAKVPLPEPASKLEPRERRVQLAHIAAVLGNELPGSFCANGSKLPDYLVCDGQEPPLDWLTCSLPNPATLRCRQRALLSIPQRILLKTPCESVQDDMCRVRLREENCSKLNPRVTVDAMKLEGIGAKTGSAELYLPWPQVSLDELCEPEEAFKDHAFFRLRVPKGDGKAHPVRLVAAWQGDDRLLAQASLAGPHVASLTFPAPVLKTASHVQIKVGAGGASASTGTLTCTTSFRDPVDIWAWPLGDGGETRQVTANWPGGSSQFDSESSQRAAVVCLPQKAPRKLVLRMVAEQAASLSLPGLDADLEVDLVRSESAGKLSCRLQGREALAVAVDLQAAPNGRIEFRSADALLSSWQPESGGRNRAWICLPNGTRLQSVVAKVGGRTAAYSDQRFNFRRPEPSYDCRVHGRCP